MDLRTKGTRIAVPWNRRMLSQSRSGTYPLKACQTTNRQTIGLYSASEGPAWILAGIEAPVICGSWLACEENNAV
jgi:hypothetical protein